MPRLNGKFVSQETFDNHFKETSMSEAVAEPKRKGPKPNPFTALKRAQQRSQIAQNKVERAQRAYEKVQAIANALEEAQAELAAAQEAEGKALEALQAAVADVGATSDDSE